MCMCMLHVVHVCMLLASVVSRRVHQPRGLISRSKHAAALKVARHMRPPVFLCLVAAFLALSLAIVREVGGLGHHLHVLVGAVAQRATRRCGTSPTKPEGAHAEDEHEDTEDEDDDA